MNSFSSFETVISSLSIYLYAVGDDSGSKEFVARSEELLKSNCSTFEAPTVIHYEEGQVLVPHYDANREASVRVL